MNKNINKILAFAALLVIVVFWGCKKYTLNDALPVVKMTSVKMLGTDSVIVTGTITSDNGDDIADEGFCYGTDADPAITENQKLLQMDSATFSAHLFASQDSTYYFRCFAANSFGYAISSPIK